MQFSLEGVDNLGGHTFLHLETPGEALHESGQFRQTRDTAVGAGQIGHVRQAGEGHEVVFTERGEGNVANQDHLVVAGFEGNAQVRTGVLVGTVEELDVHISHSTRGVSETVTRWVVTERGQQLGDERRHAFAVNHGYASPTKV
jgi:hypothetical protein